MPERLEWEVLQKARYINTLTFTYLLPFRPKCAYNATGGSKPKLITDPFIENSWQ